MQFRKIKLKVIIIIQNSYLLLINIINYNSTKNQTFK